MSPIDLLRKLNPATLPGCGTWLTDPEADAIAEVLATGSERHAEEARRWCRRRLRMWRYARAVRP
jgi:hypothetical protein